MNKLPLIHINPLGFREYDARWLYEKDINLLGIENLGKGLGTQIIKNTQKKNPRIVVVEEIIMIKKSGNLKIQVTNGKNTI